MVKQKKKRRIISLYPKDEYEKPQYFEKAEVIIELKKGKKMTKVMTM